MNQVSLVGRLTVDPELRYLLGSGTAIARFSIAIDRSYKKDNKPVTDFIPIEVWGKVAEFCATYLQKGRLVAITGSIHFDRGVDSQGENKTYAKVSAKSVQALDYKKDNKNQQNSGLGINGRDENALDPNGFQAIDDEDLPF